jgi:hypothetical protein
LTRGASDYWDIHGSILYTPLISVILFTMSLKGHSEDTHCWILIIDTYKQLVRRQRGTDAAKAIGRTEKSPFIASLSPPGSNLYPFVENSFER